MTRNDHNAPATAHVVRHSFALLLACLTLLCAPAARALDTGDIVIASLKGEVHVSMKGSERAVKVGAVLETPATVRTGPDGAIELRQGATSVSVGPDTLLEFPEVAARGGPIDRIVQPRGNAFYDIGKRPGRKLRVETPWLVGVVKGTQFNVAVQDDGTTISLFEGLLEIRASDETSVVDIKSGEIAMRRRGDKGIGVLKMDAGKAPAPRTPAGASSRGTSGDTPPPGSRLVPGNDDPAGAVLVDRGNDGSSVTGTREPPATGALLDDIGEAVAEVAGEAPVETSAPAGLGVGASLDVGAAGAPPDVIADVSAGAEVSAGAATVQGALDAGVDLGPGAANVEVGVSTGVDPGAAAPVDVDAGVDAAVDVGDASGVAANVDLGVSADVGNVAAVDSGVGAGGDLGNNLGNRGAAVTVDVSAGANAGPLSTGAGAGVAVDLGTGGGTAASVDLGTSAGVGNVAAVDAGVGAAVNVGPATDVAANVDVGSSVAGVDAGANVGVDLGSGNVDLGVNVAGANLNVGLDLGLDDQDQDDQGQDTGNNGAPGNTNSGPGSDNSGPGNAANDVVNDVVDDVGGLLNGLLKPRRRK
jgi:hypothetical protein